MPNFRLNNASGISLIELIVVVSIIGVMAGLAHLGFGIVQKERVSSATRELLSDLQKARINGMVSGPTATTDIILGAGIRFVSPTSYVTFLFNDCTANHAYNANGCSGDREEARAVTKNVQSPVVIKKRNTDGTLADPTNEILIFDRYGYPRSDVWDQNVQSFVVMNSSTGDKKCVIVHINRIREGTWNGTACEAQ